MFCPASKKAAIGGPIGSNGTGSCCGSSDTPPPPPGPPPPPAPPPPPPPAAPPAAPPPPPPAPPPLRGGPLFVRIQSPEKSGVPAAVFGAGASIRTLPAASRGSLGSITGSHCAAAPTVQANAMRQGTAMCSAGAPVRGCNNGRPPSAGVIVILGTSI